MCVQVTCVGKTSDGAITHIGGDDGNGGHAWGLTSAEAIALLESGDWRFYVERQKADPISVLVRRRGSDKFLTTAADDSQTNNLEHLPVCAPPLSGSAPQFPLSVPAPRTPVLEKLEHSTGSQIVSLSANAANVYSISGWTSANPLRGARLTCKAPYPGDLEVYVGKHPSEPGYVEADHKLERVYSLSRRHALEAAGKGWLELHLPILSPNHPLRFTPFVLAVRFPQSVGGQASVPVFIQNVSWNARCPDPAPPLALVLRRPSATVGAPPALGGQTGGSSSKPPPRAYTAGPFAALVPATRNVGQTSQRGTRRLRIDSAQAHGIAGWSRLAVFEETSPRVTSLCQPVGFEVSGTGGGAGGAAFSASGALGVVLAVEQPNLTGMAEEVLFRFARLGAPASQPMDAPAFLTKNNAVVEPRIFLDPAEQVALVVAAYRGGSASEPAVARLLDLGKGAGPLREIPFDGTGPVSATVVAVTGGFEAHVVTSAGTDVVPLPKS